MALKNKNKAAPGEKNGFYRKKKKSRGAGKRGRSKLGAVLRLFGAHLGASLSLVFFSEMKEIFHHWGGFCSPEELDFLLSFSLFL